MNKITFFPMTLFTIIIIGLGLWVLYGYLSVRNIEKPAYTVFEPKSKGSIANNSTIELRTYDSMIVAETVVDGPYDKAVNNGFRTIANYIFGNNTSSSLVSMTSPVIQEPSSEGIAMTTPVLQQQNKNKTYTISFVMPSKYTMESIPKPTSSNVKLREVKEHMVAAISFSGLWTDAKADRFTGKLINALEQDGYQFKPKPQFARYNPPWTPPWMRKNEVWLELLEQNTN